MTRESRAIARIIFQLKQRGKPESGCGAPSMVQRQSPWSGVKGPGGKPPEAESFSAVGCPK